MGEAAGPRPRISASAPLARPAFRWLFLGATVSRFGNSIAPVALAFAVLDLTGSAAQLGIVVASRSVANVLFLLIGGVIADRLPRGLVLVGSSLASAATQALVAVVIATGDGSVLLLSVLSALNGVVAATSLPAAAALLPQTVPESELITANALSRLGSNAAAIFGTAVAGFVAATWGADWGIGIDAATYALAAAMFFKVPKAEESPNRVTSSMLRELHEGWTAFWSREWLWVVVVAFTVINAVQSGAVTVLGPVVADKTFGRAVWGLTLTGQAVGFLLGSFLALRLRIGRLLRYGMFCMFPLCLPVFALAYGFPAWTVFVAFLISGLGTEQFGVAWQTTLHRKIPISLLARVSSYDMLGSFIAIPIGQVAAGPIASSIGLRSTLIAGGILMIAATGLSLVSRDVRTLT